MKRVVVLSMLAVGCRFELPPASAPPDGAPADTGSEGGPCTSWTTRGGHIDDACAKPPVASWRVGGTSVVTYNTETEAYSGGAAPASYLFTRQGLTTRVVSVTDFSVDSGATLRVVGAHALLVLSATTISISGVVDVSSRRVAGAPEIGAGTGTDASGCQIAQNGQGTTAAGGGGGGGYKIAGADGGNGDGNARGNGAGTLNRPRLFIMGGCRGGAGGMGAGASAGGGGGGAIQLTAKESITLTGTGQVLAGGMGGQGAQNSGLGGGGGGSGGFIGLDAPLVTAMTGSVLAANGGAGGAGCTAGTGDPGEDGKALNEAAIGGSGAGCINDARGGNGSARVAATPGDGIDADAASAGGGGGGGGGMGYIVVWAPPGAFMRNGLNTPPEDRVNGVEP